MQWSICDRNSLFRETQLAGFWNSDFFPRAVRLLRFPIITYSFIYAFFLYCIKFLHLFFFSIHKLVVLNYKKKKERKKLYYVLTLSTDCCELCPAPKTLFIQPFIISFTLKAWGTGDGTYLSAMDDTWTWRRDAGLRCGRRDRCVIAVRQILQVGLINVIVWDPRIRMLQKAGKDVLFSIGN